MKNPLFYSGIFILLAALLLLYSCGPSEEEQQRREQAHQDSLEQVRQDSLEQVPQQQQDSLARQDSVKANEQQQTNISFSEDGRFALQVSSWRSEVKAQQEANRWNERGYQGHAYVVQHGNKQTGDVWFRVRIGRVDTREAAEQLRQNLLDEYQTESWIATD